MAKATKKPVNKYQRILLKLSGEALMGDTGFGVCPDTVNFIAKEIKSTLAMGTEIAVVIGGGNIFRGIEAATKGMERVSADYMDRKGATDNA